MQSDSCSLLDFFFIGFFLYTCKREQLFCILKKLALTILCFSGCCIPALSPAPLDIWVWENGALNGRKPQYVVFLEALPSFCSDHCKCVLPSSSVPSTEKFTRSFSGLLLPIGQIEISQPGTQDHQSKSTNLLCSIHTHCYPS